jgi:hypothetical protein
MPSNTNIHGRSLVGLDTGTTIKTYVIDLSYRYEISISQMTMDLSSITDKAFIELDYMYEFHGGCLIRRV